MNKNYFLKSFRVVFPLLVFLFSITVTSQTCPDIHQRVYATHQNWTTLLPILGGGVDNPDDSIDEDPTTYSTLNTGIALAGIGTTSQTLSWGGGDIDAGTPVSVKLGIESGVLAVGSAVTIRARRDGSNIGSIQTVTADLLTLVSGESVYEFTFIPESGGTAAAYDEIRITASAPVGIGFSVRVYEAYYHDATVVADCSQGDFIDLFYGVEDLGIGALTGTVGVINPWNAIDGDSTTYATLSNGIAVLAQSQLTAVFSSPVTSDDQVEVVISDASIALSIEALNGFTIQRYYGNTAVGVPMAADNNGLSIGFLGVTDSQAVVILNPQDGLSYDRIKISLGGVANVLDGMRIHEISRKAGFNIVGAPYGIIHLTPGSPTSYTIDDPSGCTTFVVTDQLGNTLVMNGNTFELPTGLTEGEIYSFNIQGSRYGCTFGAATQITVVVGDTGICPGANQRVYATNQSNGTTIIGGSVSDGDFAVDGDPGTHSTINVTLAALGLLGNTYQDISWGGTNIPAGTPVSIKLGPGSGLLGVSSGLSVVARKDGVNIGTMQNIDSSLLSLLAGENVYEYSFTPSFGGIPQEYDEIRIMLGGALAAGISANIYEVYYHTTTDTLASCDGDILDLFYGVEDLGLGILTGTAGVINPWNAADGDTETFSELSNNISLLAQTSLTAVFSSALQGTDQVEIMVSSPSTALSVVALNGLTIQRYYGSQPVGSPMSSSNNTVSVSFLGSSDNEAIVIVSAQDDLAYDRIQISLGGVAEILSDLRIHEITRKAGFLIDGIQDSVIYWEVGDSTSFTIQEPTTCTTFEVTDESGNALVMTGNTFELPSNMVEGQTYYFYVQPYRYGCPFGEPKEIVVLAGDYSITPGECPEVQNRVYATTQTSGTVLLGGTVSNDDLAIDGDPLTHSTITVVLGVLGLGSTYQDISWGGTVVEAGTPVSIKLGPEYGVLSLASGLTAVARKDGANIGSIQNIDGALLSLIPGENVYEFTFTPSVAGVPQDYDEIRISLGGVLAAGVSVRVFEVYYHTPTDTLADCGTGEVLDLFYGVEDLGIQALTATVGVTDAWDAVDGDIATYAIIYNGASVLAQAHLTTIFSSPSVEGDTIEIFVSKPGELLTLGLLEGFSIQRYYGTEEVGAPIDSSSSFLSLGLLNPGDSEGTIIFAPEDGLAFDRIKISMGGVANVLDGLRVHEITRIPFIKLTGSNDLEVVLCSDDLLSFDPVDNCSTYEVEDALGTPLVANGDYAFDLPTGLVEGTTYTFYVQVLRYGCSVGDLQEIEVTIRPRAIEADLTDILINGQPVAPICLDSGEEVELEVALSATSTIINPVFVWYDGAGDEITGGANGTLALGILPSDTYTYSVGVYGDNFCETLPADRKQVTFTVEHSGEPTDITVDGDGDQICFTESAFFVPSSTVTNPTFSWYYTNDTTLPITDGDTDGTITYAIDGSGVLSISGLAPGTTTTYYVSVTGDGVCENEAGNLAEAAVSVYDIDTPTTNNVAQLFCLVDAPTVADIEVNETGVIWYDSLTGGTAYADTDALVSGTYYGALVSAEGCESSIRLEVIININDADTPTTNNTTQLFCLVDAPTVADIEVNETGVIWYDSLTGGTAYTDTDALVSGTYYGVLVSAEGCESSVRLEVTVTVNDADTPTTTDANQEFCLVNAPIVADITVNETGVIWYDAATGGTAYADTDTLVSGTYYGALISAEGCESSVRLEVTININNADTPTTNNATQLFCLVDAPTVADIDVNEAGVIWYDALTDGTAYADTDALVSGTYYGTLISAEGCESSIRLEVTINVNDADTPTTTDANQEFCLVDAPTVADIAVNETGVIWYDAATGGTAYTATDALVNGTYYGALISAEGCESSTRLEVTVIVNDANTPTTTDANQEFCLVDAPTVADITVNEIGVIWYDAATGGTAYADTDALVSGTYYGALISAEGCESSVRLEVTVIVNDADTPTTTDANQEFCLVDASTVADIAVNETGVTWYDAATGGTAYTATDALVNGIYYGVLVSAEGCESSVRLEVTVTLNDADTPTTTDANQEFCLVDAPTVADIAVNETGVIWYDAATGGTAYATTDALVNGTYYGALISAEGCESSVRLEVTVTVNDADTPTTTDTTQEFCLVDAPTIADITVNETGVIWYDAATGGTAYTATDALVNGTYYGVLVSAEGCESSVRLEVTVTVNDADTPTTTDANQEFCLVDAPTVADIEVNETGVIWYDSLTGGTAYADTDALVSGTYYGALVSAEGCESSIRLEVIININDADTPTTNNTTQLFCLVDAPTVADIEVNETGVIWYDSLTGGTAYTDTDALVSGTYYGVLVSAEGCESSIRLEVIININDADTPTTNNTTQLFCLVDAPTVADIEVNEAGVIWYDALTGGTAYADTDALVSGTYYGALISVEGCESSVRLEVTININDADTPTTNNATQLFCLVDTPTLADINVNESGVIWYNSATGGTAYADTDALVSGTYYGALVSAEGCESSVRLEVTVTVNDADTPTTTDANQEFCLVDAPTVADINVNETGVIWYDALTDGTAYTDTDTLVSGTYYGTLISAEGCESSIRLEVIVTVNDISTPTGDTAQTFCLVDAPTVAEIVANEVGVVWYDAATGGTAYLPTDALVNGGTYYGSIVSTSGCESAIRLAVTITLEEPGTPTTDNTTQVFCLVDAPTVGDIQVNESGVIWYDAPIGGTAYSNSNDLTDGMTYYAALLTAEGCESSIRLEVAVTVNDAPTPTTTEIAQEFCLIDVPTIGDIQVNETGVIWYDAPTGGTAYAITDELANGTYYAALVSAEGCESSVRLEVSISVLEGGDTTITPDTTGEICLNTIVSYTTEAGQSNYDWEVEGGDVVGGGSSSDNFVDVMWTSVGSVYVAVGYEGINGCYNGDTYLLDQEVVVCADLTITKEANNLTPMMGEEVTFTITVTNEGPNDFENVMVSEVLQSGFEYISSQASLGAYNHLSGAWEIDLLPAGQSAVLSIVVKILTTGDYVNVAAIVDSTPIDSDPGNNEVEIVLDPICLFVFNEFSPNGDGINEYFMISCIENYPNNEIKIFNKYGSLVFKQKGYSNNWDGVANVGGISSSGEVLPSDTYYYVLDLGDNRNTKTGWLFIIK